MRRTFWLALGVALGVVAARRVSKAWRAHAPAQLTHRVGEWTDQQRQTARQFVDAVRTNAAEREAQLREAIEQDAPRAPAPLTRRLGRRTPNTPNTSDTPDAQSAPFDSAAGRSTDSTPNTFSPESTERTDRRPGL